MSATAVRPVPVPVLELVPDRSLQQRKDALVRANDVRHRRKLLKQDMKAGRMTFVRLLCDPPDYLLSAKVHEFAMSCPKVGQVKLDSAFRRSGVSTSKTFGGISLNQVLRLSAAFRAYPSLWAQMGSPGEELS